MMIQVLFALLQAWGFFPHSLMSEVYGLLSEAQDKGKGQSTTPHIEISLVYFYDIRNPWS
jgi:hypothetical protein